MSTPFSMRVVGWEYELGKDDTPMWKVMITGIAAKSVAECQVVLDAHLESEAMWRDLMAEIATTLDALGCCHGEAGHDAGATPPMMFPEWIRCVVAHHSKKAEEPAP